MPTEYPINAQDVSRKIAVAITSDDATPLTPNTERLQTMPSHFPSSQLTSLMINLNVILHLFDLRPGYYRRHLLILHATPLSSSLLHSAPILEFSILTKQGPSCNILNFTIPLHSHHDEIQKKRGQRFVHVP